MLNSILSKKIENIELDNKTILEKDVLGEKVGILDIKAKLDNEILFDIELQVAKQEYIEKRMLYYWSKLYISDFKEGNKYFNLKKTISILIADFELEVLKNMPGYHTKWEIRESEYGKVVLTDVLELHILEIPKLVYQIKEECNKKLLNWLRFIKNPEIVEELDMEENKAMRKAKEEYENFNQDEHEQYLAELREKYWHDMASFEYTGEIQGIKKGKKENSMQIAKKLLKIGMSIEQISEITELTKEEIESL